MDDDSATEEDVIKLRNLLLAEFPDLTYRDDYLMEVLNGITKGKRRTFEYAHEKLVKSFSTLKSLEGLTISPNDPRIQRQLAANSLYWHGYDYQGRPILWSRPIIKDFDHIDVEAEALMHVLMLETGIRLMPPGVEQICMITDTSGFGLKHNNRELMKKLSSVLLDIYPDRLSAIICGPVNQVIRGLAAVFLKFLPQSVSNKLSFFGRPKTNKGTGESEIHTLAALIPNCLIPDFFGGPMAHPGEFNWDHMMAEQQRLLDQFLQTPRGSLEPPDGVAQLVPVVSGEIPDLDSESHPSSMGDHESHQDDKHRKHHGHKKNKTPSILQFGKPHRKP